MKALRNPLERAINHGSAGSGVHHWWAQRFSAILLVPLTVWLVWTLAVLAGADYAVARDWIAAPWNAAMAILLVGSTFYHARLGVQVVIEDYVHQRALEVSLQILVAIAALVGAVVSIIAILKVAFAG
ncbi:MAG: succinate dehydrogenase, hydrophobic membrane anchor protein [Wenzhouxiangellaceae bacterium]|nr:succinate dehydrogenase, hydrophobic membrane anchor protein [Wenzhouxiangellaceae bacterium]MBS3747582.1 succinate dehydrogenase, hydrophobic membrane anchor protein [Wenzhouxiangellaceae bacterium]MBS3823418.1 succinate dehydrogenase, hydrophobic membrane anchor protein [Wenzhouxiangellaceae bacterium]